MTTVPVAGGRLVQGGRGRVALIEGDGAARGEAATSRQGVEAWGKAGDAGQSSRWAAEVGESVE